jgi:hypothetical protein
VSGSTDAEVKRLNENARAQAQAQMIRAIVEGLPANADPATLQRIVILRTLQALEQMRLDPRSPQFFPSQALALLQALRAVAP